MLYKQNEYIKNKFKKNHSVDFTIQYLKPDINYAMLNDKCPLFIAPIENSNIISYLPKESQVKIIDSALVSGKLWYEIYIESIEKINNKGWIKSNFIS